MESLDEQKPSIQTNIPPMSKSTGTKCLPSSAIPKCNGMVLHDCHAETLAFRGFNQWILKEIQTILEQPGYISNYIEPQALPTNPSQYHHHHNHHYPFKLKPTTSIYLFTTTAPCGDASMDLLMSSKPIEDSIPWEIPPPSSPSNPSQSQPQKPPLGRAHFSLLGPIRRKPSRADATPTLSKSCTDKIALKQFTTILGFPVDLLVAPTEETYLRGLVVYCDEFHEVGYLRAFGREGRLRDMVLGNVGGGGRNGGDKGGGLGKARFFETMILPREYKRFEFEKQDGAKSTNLAALWISAVAGGGLEEYNGDGDGDGDGNGKDKENKSATVEVLVGGVRQGFKQWDNRKGKMSVVCRRRMMEKVVLIWRIMRDSGLVGRDDVEGWGLEDNSMRYSCFKRVESRSWREEVKKRFNAGLGGWVSNSHEDDFVI